MNKNSISDYSVENDPYGSLQHPPERCAAELCRCPNGRVYVGDEDECQIEHCKLCNYVCIHAGCHEIDLKFECQRCKEIISRKSNTNACSRQSRKVDKRNEEKVWKMLPTKQNSLRKRALSLTNANEELIDIDPLSSDQQKSMRENRMDLFWNKSNFNSKPKPMPWLI